MCSLLSLLSTSCYGLFMDLDTGQEHRVEGIALSSRILMTVFCQRSASSTFTPHCPSPSSFFTPFVTRFSIRSRSSPVKQLFPLSYPTSSTHFDSQPRSPLLVELAHSLCQYFSMVAFVPFISWKTKDSCKCRTEGRRWMVSGTERKRS